MKQQIEVRLFGLNELGVKEMNEFYKANIKLDYISEFKLGEKFGFNKKQFKNPNNFKGLDTRLGSFGIKQAFIDKHGNEIDNPGNNFEWLLKHFKHEVYEVMIIENKILVS